MFWSSLKQHLLWKNLSFFFIWKTNVLVEYSVISRTGQSQGLLYKQRRISLIYLSGKYLHSSWTKFKFGSPHHPLFINVQYQAEKKVLKKFIKKIGMEHPPFEQRQKLSSFFYTGFSLVVFLVIMNSVIDLSYVLNLNRLQN